MAPFLNEQLPRLLLARMSEFAKRISCGMCSYSVPHGRDSEDIVSDKEFGPEFTSVFGSENPGVQMVDQIKISNRLHTECDMCGVNGGSTKSYLQCVKSYLQCVRMLALPPQYSLPLSFSRAWMLLCQ